MTIPIKLPREQKANFIRQVQAYFLDERGEELGELGAEQFVDMMIRELGPFIYNKAIQDARALAVQQAVRMEEELYALERPTPK